MRNFEKPTRSLVLSREAMAATSHPSATLTAIRILDRGGNAMDAAIAACAVQAVVEPQSTGIGGDCFALYSKQGSDQIIAYNGSGRMPRALDADWFRRQGLSEIPRQSPAPVTIPGAIDAWTRLHKDHGHLPFDMLMQPAIDFAEQGYAISPRVHRDWVREEALLSGNEAASRIFLADGKAPAIGAVHRQPALAATLRRIAREGRSAFYEGEIAEEMVALLRERGGCHDLEDFATAAGDYVTPISLDFRQERIHECPPNGQGVIALMILNILKRFPASGDPLAADRLHVEIEATRLAYAARAALLADPQKAEVPVDDMLSDAMADRLAARIDLRQALTDLPAFGMPKHRDTVYICVVDKDRNAVSLINSVFDSFGTGLVTPTSGIVLHNRGQSFSLEKGHPNEIGPSKRPLHTIIPGMVTRNGKAIMPFGVMGGYYQAMGHAHLISKIYDFGMDIQEAIDLPRLIPTPSGRGVEIEHTLPQATAAELQARGFELVASEDPIGGAQAIAINWETGVLSGGSESRKDGCALGL